VAVTNLIATPLGGGQFRLTWSGSADAYYVYRDGALLGTTEEEEFVVSVAAGSSPVFEVLDDELAAPGRAYPGTVTLAFYHSVGADFYVVEELVSAVWTERARIANDGSEFFTWQSSWLLDDTTYQFRVTPVGTNGNAGTPITLTALVVHVPDEPDVEFAYAAGTGKVTISAA
jgi:hypothetical protein